jgi:hypothetical protein
MIHLLLVVCVGIVMWRVWLLERAVVAAANTVRAVVAASDAQNAVVAETVKELAAVRAKKASIGDGMKRLQERMEKRAKS